MLVKKTLGGTGMSVTQLGYGSMGLRGPNTWGVRVVDDDSAEKLLHLVLDSGINFIDTAPDYGVAEERIGRFLSARRDEFYLATKCGCAYVQRADHIEINHVWQRDVVKRNVETSLERLQTEYIDLLQFHGGDAETLQRNGLIDQLLDLKSDGVIRHLGVSSKAPNLKRLIDLGVFETFQIPYSCLTPEHDQLMLQAAETNAGVIVRGGIAHGGPDAEIERPALNELWERAALDDLLDDGMSRSEFILRHTLGHAACHTTIVGTCNPKHLEENLRSLARGPLESSVSLEITARIQAVLEESQA